MKFRNWPRFNNEIQLSPRNSCRSYVSGATSMRKKERKKEGSTKCASTRTAHVNDRQRFSEASFNNPCRNCTSPRATTIVFHVWVTFPSVPRSRNIRRQPGLQPPGGVFRRRHNGRVHPDSGYHPDPVSPQSSVDATDQGSHGSGAAVRRGQGGQGDGGPVEQRGGGRGEGWGGERCDRRGSGRDSKQDGQEAGYIRAGLRGREIGEDERFRSFGGVGLSVPLVRAAYERFVDISERVREEGGEKLEPVTAEHAPGSS